MRIRTSTEVVRGKYHRQGLTPMYKCFKNYLFIGGNTSLPHLLAVATICWKLRKQGHDIITEAVKNGDEKRRYDIVDLTTGQTIEIEKSGKFKPDAGKSYKLISQEEYEKRIKK